ITGFWRPRLQHCPTTHYRAEAGKALPAIPLGVIGRVGAAGGQRLALLRGLVRAEATEPSPAAHNRRVLEQAGAGQAPTDALVVDAGFGVSLLLQVGATAWIARARKNFTARRATPPPYAGGGRPVEQLPLAAKQMLGAARQFLHAPEACQRLPEVALLAGAILSYLAATGPAVPTGFWDRHPQRTPGRLRRLLASCPFPFTYP